MGRPKKMPTGTWDQYRLFASEETSGYLALFRKLGLHTTEEAILAWIRLSQAVMA